MTRVRVVSLRSFDPAVNNLGPRAFRAWQKAIDWCCFYATDGMLTPKCIKAIGASPADLKELCEALLWQRLEDGRTLVLELRNGPAPVIDVEGSEVEQEDTRKPSSIRQARWRAKRNTVDDPASTKRLHVDVYQASTDRLPEASTGVDKASTCSPGSPSLSSESDSLSQNPEGYSALISSSDLTGSARVGRKKRERKGETTFPEGFFPNETDLKCAQKLRLHEPYQRECFRDKALEKGWLAQDWHARYRNYMRKAVEFAARDGRPANGSASDDHRRPYHEPFVPEASGPGLSPAESLQLALQGQKAARSG